MEAVAVTLVCAGAVVPAAALVFRAVARLPRIPVVEASVIAILVCDAAVTIAELRGASLPSWAITMSMVSWLLFLLIFPSGRPTNVRLAVVAAVAAVLLVAAEFSPSLRAAVPIVFILCFAAVSVGQVWRYVRRLSIAERQTTKWLLLGLLPAVAVFLGVGVISLLPGADPQMLHQPWYLAASIAAMWVVPIAATAGLLLQDRGPIDELIRFGIAGTGTILLAAATFTTVAGFAGAGWAAATACALVLPGAWLFLRIGTTLAYARGPQRPLAALPARLGASPDPAHIADVVATTIRDSLGVPGVDVVVGGEVLSRLGEESAAAERIGVDFDEAQVAELLIAPRAGEANLTRRDHLIVGRIVVLAAPALRGAYAAREAANARAQLETARTDERRRLHADLHDELGPALAGLGFTARAAATTLAGTSPDVEKMLGSIETGTQALVARVREISHDLQPEDLGGARLEAVLEERLRTADDPLRVRLECEPVPDHLVIDILRIVQEAVANVRRHAAATSCTVRVRVDDTQRVWVTVSDNGQGAAPGAMDGIGHPSIRSRAHKHGGWLDFESSPTGSRLTAVLRSGPS